jgi:hypothetical protein
LKEIPLSQGKVALVDDADYAVVSALKWHAVRCSGNKWYARNTGVYLHRFLIPDSSRVDHRNGDGLDNQRANLRGCTHRQNIANQARSSANTSGYKGVTWDKDRQKWIVHVGLDNKMHFVGRFKDIIEAARAYDAKATELHGEFANLNFSAED